MGIKRHKPEEIVTKLRQVEVLVGQGMARIKCELTNQYCRADVLAWAQPTMAGVWAKTTARVEEAAKRE